MQSNKLPEMARRDWAIAVVAVFLMFVVVPTCSQQALLLRPLWIKPLVAKTDVRASSQDKGHSGLHCQRCCKIRVPHIVIYIFAAQSPSPFRLFRHLVEIAWESRESRRVGMARIYSYIRICTHITPSLMQAEDPINLNLHLHEVCTHSHPVHTHTRLRITACRFKIGGSANSNQAELALSRTAMKFPSSHRKMLESSSCSQKRSWMKLAVHTA